MQIKRSGSRLYVVLAKEEPLIATLKQVMIEHSIQSGAIQGIGALKEVRMGFYHLSQKKYHEETFPKEYELISLDGNMSWFQEDPIVHCHVAIGDDDFKVYGGHLFEAKVAVTTEIQMEVGDIRIQRRFDECIGLNLQML